MSWQFLLHTDNTKVSCITTLYQAFIIDTTSIFCPTLPSIYILSIYLYSIYLYFTYLNSIIFHLYSEWHFHHTSQILVGIWDEKNIMRVPSRKQYNDELHYYLIPSFYHRNDLYILTDTCIAFLIIKVNGIDNCTKRQQVHHPLVCWVMRYKQVFLSVLNVALLSGSLGSKVSIMLKMYYWMGSLAMTGKWKYIIQYYKINNIVY